jgi:hypothetical protein
MIGFDLGKTESKMITRVLVLPYGSMNSSCHEMGKIVRDDGLERKIRNSVLPCSL